VDALRRHARLIAAWYTVDVRRCEHSWARLLTEMRGAELPAAGFGSSDCRCPAHLIRFERRPSRQAFRRRLRSVLPDAGALRAVAFGR